MKEAAKWTCLEICRIEYDLLRRRGDDRSET